METHEHVPALLEPIGRVLRRHPKVNTQLNRALAPFENSAKVLMFSCNMCGQCLLHENGYTCLMNCPKQLRNGPCGGVRMNGHCEVKPEMECVWLKAERRSRQFGGRYLFLRAHGPLDWRRKGSSAILNAVAGWPGDVKANGKE